MKEYVWQWMTAAVLCGLGGQLLPGGENGAFGKHWRLLCGVCMTLLLIRPITGFVESGADLSQALRDYWTDLSQQAEAQDSTAQQYRELDAHLVAYAIEQALCERFDITAEEMTVSIRIAVDGEQVEAVYVALSGQAVWKDSHAIERYIREAFGCTGTVYIP